MLRACDSPQPLTAAQQSTLLRFADIIKTELDASGARLALVARSGTDLARVGLRYSHAGISLRASPNVGMGAPWSVRQLYYACDEGRPRLFDQGLPGFLLGTDSPHIRYLSVLLLPTDAAAALEQRAHDKALALQLLGGSYSANAYAFSTRYQNCNQWLAELLALSWGGAAVAGPDPRAAAQAWLQAAGYVPTSFDLGNPLLLRAISALPWLHSDDHPPDDLARAVFRVSMPASIDAFVRARVPGVQRLEFCHSGPRVVLRRGWEPLAEGCEPAEGDTVLLLD